MDESRQIVTRTAREIEPGDVVVWRGLYLLVQSVAPAAGFLNPAGLMLTLGHPVRGPSVLHPPALLLNPDDLVIRWELKRPPRAEMGNP